MEAGTYVSPRQAKPAKLGALVEDAALDSAGPTTMSPLEFITLPVEKPVCGGRIPCLYACSGSLAARHLSPLKIS